MGLCVVLCRIERLASLLFLQLKHFQHTENRVFLTSMASFEIVIEVLPKSGLSAAKNMARIQANGQKIAINKLA